MGLQLWGADSSLEECSVEGAGQLPPVVKGLGSETLWDSATSPLRGTSCRDGDQTWSLLVVPLSVHMGVFSKAENIRGH